MDTYIFIFLHKCTNTHTHIYMCVSVGIYIRKCMVSHTHTHTHIHTHIDIKTLVTIAHVYFLNLLPWCQRDNKYYASDKEVKTAVTKWLKEQSTD